MADAILMSGGAGGVTSDDVTASKAQVLQGYRTITSDSDDEVIEGQIVNRGNIVDTVSFENAYWDEKFLARMEQGFYLQNGKWKPCVAIPYAVLANVAGVDANKILSNLTIAGTTGKIKIVNTQDNNYRVNKSNAFGIDNWTEPSNPTFYIDLPYGNAYYNRNDGRPHTCIDASNLGTAGADSVLQWQTASSQQGIKFEGSIPRWICTTGGVITALNNEGFVWDDSSGANRGRGIVTRIPDKHFIQDASYVFLASPNFYPQNLVKNININGITGTRDYIDLISPTWLSDVTLNLQVNTVEKEIHVPNKFLQYNGLFMKVIVWGSTLDGYYKDSNGGACPCVLAVTNWDGGANFTVKVGAAMFYGTLERQGSGFDDFKLRYRGSTAFNLSLNFLITQGFSHQWAGNYAT